MAAANTNEDEAASGASEEFAALERRPIHARDPEVRSLGEAPVEHVESEPEICGEEVADPAKTADADDDKADDEYADEDSYLTLEELDARLAEQVRMEEREFMAMPSSERTYRMNRRQERVVVWLCYAAALTLFLGYSPLSAWRQRNWNPLAETSERKERRGKGPLAGVVVPFVLLGAGLFIRLGREKD